MLYKLHENPYYDVNKPQNDKNQEKCVEAQLEKSSICSA
jgi:hypothetical protein